MLQFKDLLIHEIVWCAARLDKIVTKGDIESLMKLPVHILTQNAQMLQEAVKLRMLQESIDFMRKYNDDYFKGKEDKN